MSKFSLILVLLCISILTCCKKNDGGNNNSGNNNSGNNSNKNGSGNDTTKTPPPPPSPAVSVSVASVAVILPGNCAQMITITNTGPQGSTLKYTAADDGALSGFLSFNNPSGSLVSGASESISVNIKPNFINAQPSLAGASLVLDIYTPGASNFTKIPVSIKIKSVADILGTWAGTWNGTTVSANNPNQAGLVDSVKGTWILSLVSADTTKKTASGTLTWAGADAYWVYTYDKNGLITSTTPEPFAVNRTINFDASNTTLTPDGCTSFHLVIVGNKGAPNPSDAFYGPTIMVDLDVSTNKLYYAGNGFITNPYNPANSQTFVSTGAVNGTKQ